MNREEAIDRLKGLFGNGYSKQEEALNMAIKALEQRPCEDAISRQAALDCFTATKLKKFDFILYARAEIKKLPPVNPQNCDTCEVGNPCLYCRHEFEPQERSEKE